MRYSRAGFRGEECALSWRSSVADRPCDRSFGCRSSRNRCSRACGSSRRHRGLDQVKIGRLYRFRQAFMTVCPRDCRCCGASSHLARNCKWLALIDHCQTDLPSGQDRFDTIAGQGENGVRHGGEVRYVWSGLACLLTPLRSNLHGRDAR